MELILNAVVIPKAVLVDQSLVLFHLHLRVVQAQEGQALVDQVQVDLLPGALVQADLLPPVHPEDLQVVAHQVGLVLHRAHHQAVHQVVDPALVKRVPHHLVHQVVDRVLVKRVLHLPVQVQVDLQVAVAVVVHVQAVVPLRHLVHHPVLSALVVQSLVLMVLLPALTKLNLS